VLLLMYFNNINVIIINDIINCCVIINDYD